MVYWREKRSFKYSSSSSAYVVFVKTLNLEIVISTVIKDYHFQMEKNNNNPNIHTNDLKKLTQNILLFNFIHSKTLEEEEEELTSFSRPTLI